MLGYCLALAGNAGGIITGFRAYRVSRDVDLGDSGHPDMLGCDHDISPGTPIMVSSRRASARVEKSTMCSAPPQLQRP